jgi:hypothetical protein
MHNIKFEDPHVISKITKGDDDSQFVQVRWGKNYDEFIVSYASKNTPEVDVRAVKVPNGSNEATLMAIFEELVVWINTTFFEPSKGPIN